MILLMKICHCSTNILFSVKNQLFNSYATVLSRIIYHWRKYSRDLLIRNNYLGILDFVMTRSRSSPSEVFLGKGVLKIWSKFTGEHLYRSVISIKLLWNFIEIALQHECSSVNLLHIFRAPFSKNTYGWLLL